MSSQTTSLQNASQLFVDDEFQKIFIFDNEFEQFTFQNNTGAQATFLAGTLVGRESDTGDIVALDSANALVDEDIPIGVLAQDIVDLADATTKALQTICIAGSIAANKLILINGGDSLDTVINGQRLGDLIKSATKGIALITSDELTGFDNS